MSETQGGGWAEKQTTIFYGLILTLRSSALELIEAREIESARGMVDTIEMLESKTRGNLAPDEERMVRSVLTELRMAVVRAESAPPSAPPPEKAAPETR
ncbi:MAG TPA: DUF1844 domain-containing protein [bacterium]|nr:DUF1844 domain-containing protein [bacterium]